MNDLSIDVLYELGFYMDTTGMSEPNYLERKAKYDAEMKEFQIKCAKKYGLYKEPEIKPEIEPDSNFVTMNNIVNHFSMTPMKNNSMNINGEYGIWIYYKNGFEIVFFSDENKIEISAQNYNRVEIKTTSKWEFSTLVTKIEYALNRKSQVEQL